jgi:alpha-tubulin suppressor-like RCC1 family protein
MTHARNGRLVCSCLLLVMAALLASSTASAHAEGSAAVAWGENWHGQLGAFFRSPHEESPIPVEGLPGIRSVVAAGSFNLAVLSDGTVASWGGNVYGQLGNNGYKANWELGKSHVQVSGLSGVKAVAAANTHALALMSDGTVRAWGSNQSGQLGNGKGGFEAATGQNQRVPKIIEGLTRVMTIASGGPSNYALLEDGTIMAWGNNARGQLGVAWPEKCQTRNSPGCGQYECRTEVGNELCSPTPAPVMTSAKKPLSEVIAISAGGEAAYALLKNGEVASWGSNLKGELGQVGVETGPHNNFRPPGRVMRSSTQPLTNVAEISAGHNHVLARLKSGEVVGWGNNADGELGETGPAAAEICQVHHPELSCVKTAQPIKMPAGQVEAIAAGTQYSLALIEHKVYAWGRNERGELGNGGISSSRVATVVAGIGPVKSVSAANSHVVALLANGVQPPPPPLTMQPKAGGLDLAWTSENADRIVYRVFERPAANEAEEETEETEEPGASATGGEVGTLHNTTRPRIKGEARENQQLNGTNGTWSGTEPTRYEYEWQRCRAGQCMPIAGAVGASYVPGPADAGYTLQFIIAAIAAGETRSVATSLPTQIVKTEEEARRSKSDRVKLRGSARSMTISEIYEAPLEPVPYEIKFSAGKKVRTMAGTPLPNVPAKTAAPSPVTAPTIPTSSSCPEVSTVCSVTGLGSGPVLARSSSPAPQGPLGQDGAPAVSTETPTPAAVRSSRPQVPHRR